ncbi:hypothetical protein N9L23_06350 [Alphaproteobacteria bacterium]|nr:hypothetical protein [Alphaproteobacteria bacterium]
MKNAFFRNVSYFYSVLLKVFILLFFLELFAFTLYSIHGIFNPEKVRHKWYPSSSFSNKTNVTPMVWSFVEEVEAWSSEYEYKSFIGWQRKKQTNNNLVNYSDNNHRVTTPNNTEAKNTIWYLGSSVMWGFGQDDQHTIPSQIAKRFLNYRHINLAEQGFNTRQSLNKILTYYSEIRPGDIVLTLDGLNEINSLCEGSSAPHTHLHNDQFKIKIEEGLTEPLSYLAGFRLNKTYTARLLRKIATVAYAPPPKPRFRTNGCEKPSTAFKVAQFMTNNWEAMAAMLESRGAKFICILQPIPSSSFYNVPVDDFDTIWQQKLQSTFPILQKEGSKLGCFRDYSRFFDKYVFIDGVAHLNEHGAKRLSEAFGREIQLLVP